MIRVHEKGIGVAAEPAFIFNALTGSTSRVRSPRAAAGLRLPGTWGSPWRAHLGTSPALDREYLHVHLPLPMQPLSSSNINTIANARINPL